MIDDSKVREELVKMVGLDSVPEIDPNAIDRLDGFFDDLIDGSIDGVQVLKEDRLIDFYRDYYDSASR